MLSPNPNPNSNPNPNPNPNPNQADGKHFYSKMRKGDETLSVGQDVYLENDLQIPYVARLQEIFTYTFAPKEVYFNARWYYREADVHEYAKLQGAKADVKWEGDRLTAMPPELFFSLHNDENHTVTLPLENHTDCILTLTLTPNPSLDPSPNSNPNPNP